MHSSNLETNELKHKDGGDVLVGIAALVTEGRTPSGGKLAATAGSKNTTGFRDGPHCTLIKTHHQHTCSSNDYLCVNFENVKEKILSFWHRNIPVCVEVVLTCSCKENASASAFDQEESQEGLLLEQWYITISRVRSSETPIINIFQLVNAIRSQLYFSQITAWLTTQDEKSPFKTGNHNLKYRLTVPGETVEHTNFAAIAVRHDFPVADMGNGYMVNVTFFSLPRLHSLPTVSCSQCSGKSEKGEESKVKDDKKSLLFDDRMHVNCPLKGKHCCEDGEDVESVTKQDNNPSELMGCSLCEPSTSSGRSGKMNANHNFEKANFYSVNPFDCQRQKCFMNGSYFNGYTKDDHYCENPEQHKTKNDSSSDRYKDFSNSHRDDSGCSNNHYDKLYGGSSLSCHRNNLYKKKPNKSQILLDAIERTARKCADSHCMNGSDRRSCDAKCVHKPNSCGSRDCDVDAPCDNKIGDIFSIRKKKFSIYGDDCCDTASISNGGQKKLRDVSNVQNLRESQKTVRSGAVQRLTFEDCDDSGIHTECAETKEPKSLSSKNAIKENSMLKIEIPSPSEQAKFRKHLDSAASMVFHSQTGLPLTSSPAPVRRGKSCFDFDSSINSVSAIKSALYSTSFSTDEESESESSTMSPCSPDSYTVPKRGLSPIKYKRRGHAANLLGSFEESVLNGRLEPVSTVHGFSAELGASGSFVPKHLVCPVTVFFYTLGDNDKVSSPYLGHINLGKKGYNVPKSGTVQVTLFNPLRTVVKMFVIMYDLSDMPPNSQTFIRQRTLYMPTNCKDEDLEWGPKWLRYLIHLRFMSSKSGKIYLHSDIRMIIFRKSDMDTATAHGIDMSYELRSFTHMPTNPKFSPRK